MSDWKTYPQEVPGFNDEVVYYSHSFGMYYRGVYCDRGTTHEGTPAMLAGDLWKHGDELPPPHFPESAETTPLVEAATTAATSGDEITAEKLRAEEGWVEKYQNIYDIVFRNDGKVDVAFDGDGMIVGINLFTPYAKQKHFDITTMSELRTLIRWLS